MASADHTTRRRAGHGGGRGMRTHAWSCCAGVSGVMACQVESGASRTRSMASQPASPDHSSAPGGRFAQLGALTQHKIRQSTIRLPMPVLAQRALCRAPLALSRPGLDRSFARISRPIHPSMRQPRGTRNVCHSLDLFGADPAIRGVPQGHSDVGRKLATLQALPGDPSALDDGQERSTDSRCVWMVPPAPANRLYPAA